MLYAAEGLNHLKSWIADIKQRTLQEILPHVSKDEYRHSYAKGAGIQGMQYGTMYISSHTDLSSSREGRLHFQHW